MVMISQLEVGQEGGGVKKRGTWRMFGVTDWRHGHVFLPQERYPENFVLIS